MAGFQVSISGRFWVSPEVLGITYPDGDAVGTPVDPLRYDAAGWLKAIPGVLSEVLYDASGRPTRQTNLNGTTTTKTYSPERGFLTAISTAKGTTTIQNLGYTPDAAGLLSQVTSSFANEGWSYAYDDLHRVTSATSSSNAAENQTFQYDEIGRITSNSRLGAYTYPAAGSARPHAPTAVAGSSYSYDLNGNLTSGGSRTLTWNPDNLPIQINGTQLSYDGLGERLKNVTGGSTSLYPLGDDYEVTNGVITKYVSVDGLGVVAKRVGSQTFWLHTDRLGSIQTVTDTAGAEVQRRTYRPYGDKIADATSHLESRGWIDQRQDGETGLTYLHARYYDPAVGIFLSSDPSGADLNAYRYAGGDPINSSDRSGLDHCHEHSAGPPVHCEEGIEVTPIGGIGIVGVMPGSGGGSIWGGGGSKRGGPGDRGPGRGPGTGPGPVGPVVPTNPDPAGTVDPAESSSSVTAPKKPKPIDVETLLKKGDEDLQKSLSVVAMGLPGGAAPKVGSAAGRLLLNLTGFSFKFARHPAHHAFGRLGRLPHLQVNWWRPGVRGSGGVFRIPLPAGWGPKP